MRKLLATAVTGVALVDRFRLPMPTARVGMLPMEPGSLVMERKKLLGIKQRAEAVC